MNVNNRSTIYQAAGILASFTLLSRLVGLLRDRMFAAHFGAGDLLDAYYVAFRIPDLVFNFLILGTLSVSFIPVFTEYFIKDKEEANQIANTVLTVIFLSISALCLILFFFVPEITRLTAPGFSGVKFDNTVLLTKIFLLSPVIFTLSSVFSSVLNALRRFVLVSIAPIIYNLGIIAGIKWLYPSFGIRGLGYGVIIGALLHLLIQFSGALSAGFKFKPNIKMRHPGVKKIVKLFLPRILGVDNAQISLLVASIIGSTLLSGTIAVFNLANNLQAVAIGMFGISFAVAAFPNLSEAFAQNDAEKFNAVFVKTCINILFFVIPISILILLLRAQIVRVVLGTGNFDWQATRLTANALGIFALSIFAQSLAPLFSRAFYARHNTLTPVLIGLVALASNALLAIFLTRSIGAMGLVIAFSLSNIINAVLLFWVLNRQIRTLNDRYLVASALKIILASAAMALATYLTLQVVGTNIQLNTFAAVLFQGASAALVGLAVFALSAVILKIDEAKAALAVVRRLFFR